MNMSNPSKMLLKIIVIFVKMNYFDTFRISYPVPTSMTQAGSRFDILVNDETPFIPHLFLQTKNMKLVLIVYFFKHQFRV